MTPLPSHSPSSWQAGVLVDEDAVPQASTAAVIVVDDPAPAVAVDRGPSLRSPLAHAAAVAEAAVARAQRIGEARPLRGRRAGKAVTAGAVDIRAGARTLEVVQLCRVFGPEDLAIAHEHG